MSLFSLFRKNPLGKVTDIHIHVEGGRVFTLEHRSASNDEDWSGCTPFFEGKIENLDETYMIMNLITKFGLNTDKVIEAAEGMKIAWGEE